MSISNTVKVYFLTRINDKINSKDNSFTQNSKGIGSIEWVKLFKKGIIHNQYWEKVYLSFNDILYF